MTKMRALVILRHSFKAGLLLAAADIAAQSNVEIQNHQLQLQQQRSREEAARAAIATPDVRLERVAAPHLNYPENESPCFVIHAMKLDGAGSRQFAWALDAAREARDHCLGSVGVNVVLSRVQNALIKAGFVTTRVLAPAQDLRSGSLSILLVPGIARTVRYADPAPGTRGRQPASRFAIPSRRDGLLNLRDVEQGLENLKRVPSADADIQIVPGSRPGESDLVIAWRQSRPWRVNLALDDGGNKSTGKYQATATLAVDSPLGLHDLFDVSLSNDLNVKGKAGPRGTRGHALHYSVPYGYWLLSTMGNDYVYRQSVAGATQNYLYSGTSRNLDLSLSRVLFRDITRKLGVSLRAYRRTSNNFINDTEVQVQRRRMRGVEVGLNGKQFIGRATVHASVSIKRGLGATGIQSVSGAQPDDVASRPKIWSADAEVLMPFRLRGSQLNYLATWRGQWSRTALVTQDQFGIGGRYTVRGFDGESSLLAERGWLLRNDLAWMPEQSSQQFYLFIDYAAVGGPAANLLAGTRLGGAGLGWRGQWRGLQYDLFAGKPVIKPSAFQTSDVAHGFNFSYLF